jgi:transcription termination factor Rho
MEGAGDIYGSPKSKELLPYCPAKRLFLQMNEYLSSGNGSMLILDVLSLTRLGQCRLIPAPRRIGKSILL